MLKFNKFILESEQFEINEDLIVLIGNHLEQLIINNKILAEYYLNAENLDDEEWRHDWEIGDEESDNFELCYYFNIIFNVDGYINDELFKKIEDFKTFLKEAKKVFSDLELDFRDNPIKFESCINVTIYHKNLKSNKILNNLFKSSKTIKKFNL